jgi:3-methylfumaryl-CoA hydratase
MDIDRLKDWIGRTETTDDVAADVPLRGLSALLDHETPPWRHGVVPPLGHWLYFLTRARQSEIGEDGHPRRGGFLPPIELPRRMWAGSRLVFHAPIGIGARISRRSMIADVSEKSGTTGRMIFVTVRHEISSNGHTAIHEEQDIVFRDAPGTEAILAASLKGGQDARAPRNARHFTPDATQLFRFSALTFNAHRIHYDRDYCRDVEGYPGLVVQGPFTAMLLMDHFLRLHPAADVTKFEFRARRPLYDTAAFDLCLEANGDGADLWARDGEGATAMVAHVAAA